MVSVNGSLQVEEDWESSIIGKPIEDLTKLKGIGPSIALKLKSNGFSSIQEIAQATSEQITQIQGIGATTANKMISNAKEFINGIQSSNNTGIMDKSKVNILQPDIEIRTPITMDLWRETRIESDFSFIDFNQRYQQIEKEQILVISTRINNGGVKINLFVDKGDIFFLKKNAKK